MEASNKREGEGGRGGGEVQQSPSSVPSSTEEQHQQQRQRQQQQQKKKQEGGQQQLSLSEKFRLHARQTLFDTPEDPFWLPFSSQYLVKSIIVLGVLSLCIFFSSRVTLNDVTPYQDLTLLWLFSPVATLFFCLSGRAFWPYLIPATIIAYVGMAFLKLGRISGDFTTCIIIVAPDMLGIFFSVLILRPIILGTSGLVRSTTFIRLLFIYILVIVQIFSLIDLAIIILVPTNPLNWGKGQKLVLAWLVGDFFSTYFSVYTVLVFRHYMGQATGGSYSLSRIISLFNQNSHGSTLLRAFEFASFMALTYGVAQAVATSYSDMDSSHYYLFHSFLLLISRIMFPILGFVAFRFGQLGSCVAVIITASAIFTYTYFQLDNSGKQVKQDVYYQINILLAPYMVMLYTFLTTFLATALAEKQDALSLLKERNAQLLIQGRELEEARLAAQHALNTKTEFFARVSHEFRTPLNIILNFAEEIILNPSLSPYARERVSYIMASGEGLLRIVDDILELFRLSSHRLQINVDALDIHAYFTTLCDLVQVITDKNQLYLHREIDESIPRHVLLDKIRFSQLIMNLASNAAKFTCKGGNITIRLKKIECEECPPGHVCLRLEVEDDGIGIPKDMQKHVFDCFFTRGSSGRGGSCSGCVGNGGKGGRSTTSEDGHGLGLAITKELVEVMKGKIELQSQMGLGSLFMISLPIQVVSSATAADGGRVNAGALNSIEGGTHEKEEGEGVEQDGPDGEEEVKEGEKHVVRRLKILVVEDLLPNQLVLDGILKADRHEVQFVETAKQALNLLNRYNSRFDAVFLDLLLPDQHGRDIIRHIRSSPMPSIRNMVVIVISAIVLDDERASCKRDGADDFLSKPVRRVALRECLWQHFGGPSSSTRGASGRHLVGRNGDAAATSTAISFQPAPHVHPAAGYHRHQYKRTPAAAAAAASSSSPISAASSSNQPPQLFRGSTAGEGPITAPSSSSSAASLLPRPSPSTPLERFGLPTTQQWQQQQQQQYRKPSDGDDNHSGSSYSASLPSPPDFLFLPLPAEAALLTPAGSPVTAGKRGVGGGEGRKGLGRLSLSSWSSLWDEETQGEDTGKGEDTTESSSSLSIP